MGFPASAGDGGRDTPSGRRMLRPQKTLDDAAAFAKAAVVPSGVGLDSVAVRRRLVERLRAGGGVAEGVLQAFEAVPRHVFVDSALVQQAYEDTSLPIGLGQTISKPSVVARMLTLLVERPTAPTQGPPLGRVLEIGSGCGYQAALLALLARSVVSIERLGPLHEKAAAHLKALGLERRVRLLHRDGMGGYPPQAPYDTIVAAAGGAALPPEWLTQLAVGGRLVAPVESPEAQGQMLVVVDRDASGWHTSRLDAVHFVPLKSGVL